MKKIIYAILETVTNKDGVTTDIKMGFETLYEAKRFLKNIHDFDPHYKLDANGKIIECQMAINHFRKEIIEIGIY